MKTIAFLGWVLGDWRLDFLKKFLRLNKINFLIVDDELSRFNSIEGLRVYGLADFLEISFSEFLIIELPSNLIDKKDLLTKVREYDIRPLSLNDFYRCAISEGCNLLPFDNFSLNEYLEVSKRIGRYSKEHFIDDNSFSTANDLLLIFRGNIWERFYSYIDEKTVEESFIKICYLMDLISESRCFVLVGEEKSDINYFLNQIINLKVKFFDQRVFFEHYSNIEIYEASDLAQLLINDQVKILNNLLKTYLAVKVEELLRVVKLNYPDNFIFFARKSLVDFNKIYDDFKGSYKFGLIQSNSDPESLLVYGKKC